MSFFRRAGAEILRVIEQAADPAAEADRVLVYGKDVAGLTQLFARLSDGTVLQLSPASFAPARVLFVAQSWPAGADPTRYFTTIATALAATPALAPTAANPISIYIFPGTYADPLVLVSNVHLFTDTRRAAIVTGAVAWTPGAGVNAPQTAALEEISVAQLRFTNTIAIDSTAKAADTSAIDLRAVSITGTTITVLSRAGVQDVFQAWDCVITPTVAMSFNNTFAVNLYMGLVRHLTMTGTAECDIVGTEVAGSVSINTPGQSSRITAMRFLAAMPVNILAGSVDFTGSLFQPGTVLTVSAGAAADVRMAEYGSLAQLAGAGTIDRSIWRTTFGPTGVGANVVPIAPPLPDANYDVSVELTAAGAMPFVSAKTGANFTINDALGGNTYNLTVLKE